MRKSLFSLLILFSAYSSAHDVPVITMTTRVDAGKMITLGINARDNNAKVFIDYGDGVLKEKTINHTGEKTNGNKIYYVSDTLKGHHLKIYAPETDILALDCSSNRLSMLDVSACKELISLNCKSNRLDSLDISKNEKLSELVCLKNSLSNLDISRNKYLENLDCRYNELTSLDLSENTSLKIIDCSGNSIHSLDLPVNGVLSELYCSDNQLRSLDLTKSQYLTKVSCNNNSLENLDISQNKKLRNLYAIHNPALSTIEKSKNKSLKKIHLTQKRKNDSNNDSNSIPWYENMEIGVGLDIGYNYKFSNHSLHQFYFGLEASYSAEEKYGTSSDAVHMFSLGLGVYTGKYNGESKAIPAVSLCYSTGGLALGDLKLTLTQYSINPSFGFNVMNICKLSLGYNIGYKRINDFNMSGFNMGLTVTLGTNSHRVKI